METALAVPMVFERNSPGWHDLQDIAHGAELCDGQARFFVRVRAEWRALKEKMLVSGATEFSSECGGC